MSREAVRLYVTQLLKANTTGITIEPSFPKAEGITDIVFVQAITSNEDRVSMPRGGGRKNIDYKINMIAMTTDDDEAMVPIRMDRLLEAVFDVLRNAPLNVDITDPITHRVGKIIKFGENIRVMTDAVFQLMATQGNEAGVMESVGFTFDCQEQIVS